MEATIEGGREVALREETEGALAIGGLSRSEAIQLGQVMAASGFFTDTKSAAQGAVKIIAGQELGIPPVAALRGIDFIDGSISLSGEMLAGLVRKSERYDYRVVSSTNEECEIRFFMDGEELEPTSTFTMEDAERAELLRSQKGPKANWKRYPKMMLFWRAMTQGVRLHCPELGAGGPVYVPEELAPDITVDGHGAIVKPEPERVPVQGEAADKLRTEIRELHGELMDLNSEVMPFAMFNALLTRHDYAEERLRDLKGHVGQMVDTEKQIAALEDEARGICDVNDVDRVVRESKGRKQQERLAVLQALVAKGRKDGGE